MLAVILVIVMAPCDYRRQRQQRVLASSEQHLAVAQVPPGPSSGSAFLRIGLYRLRRLFPGYPASSVCLRNLLSPSWGCSLPCEHPRLARGLSSCAALRPGCRLWGALRPGRYWSCCMVGLRGVAAGTNGYHLGGEGVGVAAVFCGSLVGNWRHCAQSYQELGRRA